MEWDEFIGSLKEAKKRKKNKGISVPTIASLLFGGAMDSILAPETPKTFETYKSLFEEVKSALGSKANLAKKRKGELLGLDDVTGQVTLSLWRHQMNPLSNFDILPIVEENLKLYGFNKYASPLYQMKRPGNDKNPIPVYLTTKWAPVFQNTEHLKFFTDSKCFLAVLGIITEVKIQPYADGTKEMLKFRMYTGHEYTDEITVWPGEDGTISEHIRSTVAPMELGFALVRPKPWNGRPGGTLLRWQKLNKG